MNRGVGVVGLLLAAVLGCGSDRATGPEVSGPFNGTMTARINGTSWAATGIFPIIRTPGAGQSVIGSAGPTYDLTIGWENTGPGTYTIGQSSSLGAILSDDVTVWSASGGVGSGTLVITSMTSSRITGTFSFVVVDETAPPGTGMVAVTDGVFSISYSAVSAGRGMAAIALPHPAG